MRFDILAPFRSFEISYCSVSDLLVYLISFTNLAHTYSRVLKVKFQIRSNSFQTFDISQKNYKCIRECSEHLNCTLFDSLTSHFTTFSKVYRSWLTSEKNCSFLFQSLKFSFLSQSKQKISKKSLSRAQSYNTFLSVIYKFS
jgi:hypothetical protein